MFLPKDRPLLRAANSQQFPGRHITRQTPPQLTDVHMGLGPSGVKGGQVHMIWGNYSYFHYMQASYILPVLMLSENRGFFLMAYPQTITGVLKSSGFTA